MGGRERRKGPDAHATAPCVSLLGACLCCWLPFGCAPDGEAVKGKVNRHQQWERGQRGQSPCEVSLEGISTQPPARTGLHECACMRVLQAGTCASQEGKKRKQRSNNISQSLEFSHLSPHGIDRATQEVLGQVPVGRARQERCEREGKESRSKKADTAVC